MLTKITKLVLCYQKSGANLKECILEISKIVYSYPKRRHQWDEDSCSDFYTYFFPRIKKSIRNFVYKTSPFESYLLSYLRFCIKSFLAFRNRNRFFCGINNAALLWHDEYSEDSFVCEHDYTVPNKAKQLLEVNNNGVISKESLKNRLLFFLLKNASKLSETFKIKSCSIMDMNIDELNNLLDLFSPFIDKRKKRLEYLQDRRNRCLTKIYQLHFAKKKVLFTCQKKEIDSKVALYKSRMQKAVYAISKVNIDPTHKEIAEILNVPKGSVDSGIFYMKSLLIKYKNEIQNNDTIKLCS